MRVGLGKSECMARGYLAEIGPREDGNAMDAGRAPVGLGGGVRVRARKKECFAHGDTHINARYLPQIRSREGGSR